MMCKVKYSEIDNSEVSHSFAKDCLYFLLKNGYISINAYNEIEVIKLIKCLKILNLKHNINFKTSINSNCYGDYEFTLDFFEDDRK